MFDARSILDAIVNSGSARDAGSPAARGSGQGSMGELGDLLKQLSGGDRDTPSSRTRNARAEPMPEDQEDEAPPAPRRRQSRPSRAEPQDDDLGEEPAPRRTASTRRRTSQDEEPGDAKTAGPGGLEDIIRDVLSGKAGGGLKDILDQVQKGGGLGGLGDILGQVLGGKPTAHRLTGDAAPASGVLGELAGKSPQEILAAVQDFIARNLFATGAAAGGLGALVLGTRTGRSLAASAAKLGGLALIGGLAYRAYQSYQEGAPVAAGEPRPLIAPPSGSGFEPETVTHETATTMLRAMVAAAAADGRIDQAEERKLVAGLGASGLQAEAQSFLAAEIANPASIDDIANSVQSEEEAVQVYTAARITVDPDIAEEHAFLAELASRLGLDEGLVAHIDGATRSGAA